MNKKILMLSALILLIGLSMFAYAAVESYVRIFKGWNLIFGFANPNQLSGGVLEANNIKAVYAFIPTTQEYARVFPNPEEDKLNLMDTNELLQTAFWVYSDKSAENLYSQEYMVEEPIPFNERPLYKGWNFVGIIPDMYKEYPSGSFTWEGVKGDCNYEKIYYYASQENPPMWVPVATDLEIDDDFVMLGFVVKVSENCKLGFTNGGITPPPELP